MGRKIFFCRVCLQGRIAKGFPGIGYGFSLRLLEFLRGLTGPCESMQLCEDPRGFGNVLSHGVLEDPGQCYDVLVAHLEPS